MDNEWNQRRQQNGSFPQNQEAKPAFKLSELNEKTYVEMAERVVNAHKQFNSKKPITMTQMRNLLELMSVLRERLRTDRRSELDDEMVSQVQYIKLRTLLARKYAPQAKNPSMDTEEIQNLFGSTSKRGSLLFSDMFLNRKRLQELQDMGINNTAEVKFENSIDRHKAIANPRQIERVIRGCLFDVQIICDVKSEEEAIRDLNLLAEGMQLLQLDYLGGNGSRGYGKVKFCDLSITCPDDSISGETLTKLSAILKAVEQP